MELESKLAFASAFASAFAFAFARWQAASASASSSVRVTSTQADSDWWSELAVALAAVDSFQVSADAVGYVTPAVAGTLTAVVTSRSACRCEVAAKVAATLPAAMGGSVDKHSESRTALWEAGVPTAVMAVVVGLMDASTPRSDDTFAALVNWLETLRWCSASTEKDGLTADVARDWSGTLQRVLAEFQANVAVARVCPVAELYASVGCRTCLQRR